MLEKSLQNTIDSLENQPENKSNLNSDLRFTLPNFGHIMQKPSSETVVIVGNVEGKICQQQQYRYI